MISKAKIAYNISTAVETSQISEAFTHMNCLGEFWKANKTRLKRWKMKSYEDFGWNPPDNDYVKINFYGRVKSNGDFAAGFWIRNCFAKTM